MRARQLKGVYKQLTREALDDFQYRSYSAITDTPLLANDGYHPSDRGRGYQAIAKALACDNPFSGHSRLPPSVRYRTDRTKP